MNAWIGISIGLALCLVPCAWLCLRGDLLQRLVGLETAGLIVPMILMTLAVADGRDSFMDLALTSTLLVFGGGLAFARFLERWL